MSTTKEQIFQYMLKLISVGDTRLVGKILDAFDGEVSKSSVYNYLGELLEKGIIEKNGTSYELVDEVYLFKYDNDGTLGEEKIFEKDIDPLLCDLPRNVYSAWRYAFTEMMNNAIEHSSADRIEVNVFKNALKITVIISDNGKGIFKNMQEYVKAEKNRELSLKECADILFAGKFTTARSMHSGEGIFFTSHLMDAFRIISDRVVFSRDNFSDVHFFDSNVFADQSTTVIMELDNNSKKTTREIFNRFSDVDEGFIKTHLPIAHIFSGAGPVSRSEARRLGELIVKFKEIELDFINVDEVGQAFVHELFIVWQRNNPDVKLTVLNACDDVDFMIRRVLNTKYD